MALASYFARYPTNQSSNQPTHKLDTENSVWLMHKTQFQGNIYKLYFNKIAFLLWKNSDGSVTSLNDTAHFSQQRLKTCQTPRECAGMPSSSV